MVAGWTAGSTERYRAYAQHLGRLLEIPVSHYSDGVRDVAFGPPAFEA
jgi:hypothetical protein